MPVTIGQGPLADFTQPLRLLSDCHRRVERFLDILEQLGRAAPESALTGAQREALDTALRYFRGAAPLHTADEESSLFPRLRRHSAARVQQLLAQVAGLEADHRHVQPMHARVDALGRQWLETGVLKPDELAEYQSLTRDLRAMYRTHIQIEDAQVFPLAREVLDPEELTEIGREMAQRRQQRVPGSAPGGRCAQRRRTMIP